MAYANGYSYRRTVTIDHTKVPNTDQTNFPILLSGTYSYLATVANGGKVTNSSGFDIIVCSDAAGTTKLDHEIEKYVSTTGQIVFWVRIPTLATATDTTIYIFYGNSSISTTQEAATAVWNSNYKAVYHLKETGGGSSGEYKDSTSNANHAQGGGGTVAQVPTLQTSGQGSLGDAQTFGGANNRFIVIPYSATLQLSSAWALQSWVKPTSAPSGAGVISEAYNANSVNYEIGFGMDEGGGGSSKFKVGFYDGSWRLAAEGSNVATGSWMKITGTWNGTSLKLYKNGSLTTTSTPGGSTPQDTDTRAIGRRHDTAGSVNYFPGDIDEVRIVAATLTADWETTEYNNQNSPSTFYTLGSETPAEPVVTTQAASSIARTSATANANITSGGGATVTARGVQYNTVTYPDKSVDESGSFSSGAFTESLASLVANTTYYYRAYATNSYGTSYGDWVSFVTSASQFQVSINSVDRTGDIINQSITIDDILNDQVDTCTLVLFDRSGVGLPSPDQEIVIYFPDGTRAFGGYIVSVDKAKHEYGKVTATLHCVDYTRLLDRNLVHKSYESMTDLAIIQDIVATYCSGLGITTTNVISSTTINQMSFNYIQPSQVLRKIAQLTGRNWYIDYSKDIHYFGLTQSPAPLNIDSTSTFFRDLQLSSDNSQLKNRIYVRGGTKLSDYTTYSVKGDGAARQFPLPDKPHSVTITVNSVAKTVGIKNVDTSGYDWYLNFQEKYLEQDSGGVVLATTDTLAVTYKYDIPILVAQEDSTSIAANGVHEFAIFDKSITTTNAARDRAIAELTDYASSLIEGSFTTITTGFHSGQYININLTEYGVNANYIIQKVTAKSLGAGTFEYDISIASAKTMGIILFLIELLEANKNLIELDDSEVVDQLFTLTDSLLSDSLLDSLTIDSAGPYRTWAKEGGPNVATAAKWNLFQWK